MVNFNIHLSCNPSNPPGTVVGPNCTQASLYESTSWCGALNDTNGIWALCLPVDLIYIIAFEIKFLNYKTYFWNKVHFSG